MNIVKTAKKRKTYLIISTLLILLSVYAIFFIKPNIGIDFSGGIMANLRFEKSIDRQDISNSLQDIENINNIQIQKVSDNEVIIRTNDLDQNTIDQMQTNLITKVGEYEELRFEKVGPTVSKNLTEKAIWAIILASLGIILYVAYAFRQVPKPASSWRFGITAILTLLHDVIIVTGIYIILGKFFGFEIDSLYIVAILTIIGYSVNDTIVIYDRIRENLKTSKNKTFAYNTNQSLVQSLSRSINTSVTLIIVLLSLLLMGGESLRSFITLLLLGAIIGTYSSIFVAPPLLIFWQENIEKQKPIN